MKRSSRLGITYAGPMGIWLTLFFLTPLIIIILYSVLKKGLYGGVEWTFSLTAYRQLVNPAFARVLLRTLFVSVTATAITMVLALPCGYAMARSRHQSLFLGLIIVPFWTNSLIRIYAWIAILSSKGFLNGLLKYLHLIEESLPLMYNQGAVITVLVYMYIPFAILPLFTTIDSFDFQLLEAARDLGSSRLTSITKVLLPQYQKRDHYLRCIHVYSHIRCLHGTAACGRKGFIHDRQHHRRSGDENTELAARFGDQSHHHAGQYSGSHVDAEGGGSSGEEGAHRFPEAGRFEMSRKPFSSGHGSTLANAVLILVIVFLFLPLFVIITYSFSASKSMEFTTFSLRWYEQLFFASDELWSAFLNSAVIALSSAAVATVLASAAAIGIMWYRFRGRHYIQMLSFLPMVLPEVIIGISMLIFFSAVRLPLGLVTIFIAHTSFNLPFVYLLVTARLEEFDVSTVEAARDLGANEAQSLVKVVIPSILPGMLSGFLMAVTMSLEDFVITFFVSGPGSTTLPLYVYSMIRYGVSPVINALSFVLILSIMLIAFSLRRFLKTIAASS